jgi:hypothetical protein
MRMMMMRTGRIPECQVVEGAILGMTTIMTMVRVRSTHRAVRKGPGKKMEERTRSGKGLERVREMVKGKVD